MKKTTNAFNTSKIASKIRICCQPPSRRSRVPTGSEAARGGSARRTANEHATVTAQVEASMMMIPGSPRTGRRRPARAGETRSLAALDAWSSPEARTYCSGSTSSETEARRAGSVSEAMIEERATPTSTMVRLGAGERSATRMMIRPRTDPPSPTTMTRRRSCRSARAPATGASRIRGARAHICTAATALAEPVDEYAMIARPKAVIPVPIEVTKEPRTNRPRSLMSPPRASRGRWRRRSARPAFPGRPRAGARPRRGCQPCGGGADRPRR